MKRIVLDCTDELSKSVFDMIHQHYVSVVSFTIAELREQGSDKNV